MHYVLWFWLSLHTEFELMTIRQGGLYWNCKIYILSFAWQWGGGEGAQAEILKCESIYEKRSKKKLLTHSESYELFNILFRRKKHKSMKKANFVMQRVMDNRGTKKLGRRVSVESLMLRWILMPVGLFSLLNVTFECPA